jgi:hypothetical protein
MMVGLMGRYQQISRAGMNEGDRRVLDEAVSRAEMLQRNIEALHQEKMQLEDALRRFENVNAQIEALHAENRKLDEAFARYRADAEAWRATAGDGGMMTSNSNQELAQMQDDNQRWRDHAQKQEEEIARLQRLLADQSKALLSGGLSPQKNRERDIELYKLRDQVLALDRNLSPAIRELQKQVIQQKIYEESVPENGNYRAGGSAPPMHDPSLRSTLPDALPSYRDTGSHTPDLFSSLSSQTPLHSSLPGRHAGMGGPLRVDRVDSSLMDAYRLAHGSPPSSSSSPPMLSGSNVDGLHRALSGSAPLYTHDGHTPQHAPPPLTERSKSPEVDPFSGVRLGIPEDILNYQPPSVSRKPTLDPSLTSPSAQHSIRGASLTPTSHTSNAVYTPSSTSRVLTNASFTGELRRTGETVRVTAQSQAPVTRTATVNPPPPVVSAGSKQPQERKVTSVNTGLSPSEYVNMRFKGVSPAPSGAPSPGRSPPGSASKQLQYGDAGMVGNLCCESCWCNRAAHAHAPQQSPVSSALHVNLALVYASVGAYGL